MGLTKVTNARVKRTGFWIFSRWHVYVSARSEFTFPNATFRGFLASDEPVAIVRDGRRALWMDGDDFYWENDGLTQEAVGLLLWDRSRRHDAKLDRLRKIKVRAEDIEARRRERIPEEVRAHVWERDDGRCVTCGAEDDLQFDHVIPVAKGGGNGVQNVQVLCGDCNLLKSDSIA